MLSQEIKQRFTEWWARENTSRPLVRLISYDPSYCTETLPDISGMGKTPEDYHMSPEFRIAAMDNFVKAYKFWCEAFPYIDLNIGPGSMATYLGSEPGFSFDTIWYNEIKAESLSDIEIHYDENAPWWVKHKELLKKAVRLSDGRYPIAIPDIQENLDILSALRGAQNLCFDLYDDPETVKRLQKVIDDAFFRYYDTCYDIVKLSDESSVFTAFSIWGEKKTAKIQCDFSAMISCETFDEYVLPALERQCNYLDNILYHLDGKDAIRHLPSLLKIEKLNAINWTPGAGQPDAGFECWYPLYDQIIDAGKGIWIGIGDGDVDSWIDRAKKILKRYGSRGIYFLFGVPDDAGAKKIIKELHL